MSMIPDRLVRQNELVILQKAERLINDLAAHINKIPKHQRYRFATRLEDALWGLAKRLIEAAVSNQKSKLYRVDEQIRYIHSLLRHAAEQRLIASKAIGLAISHLIEIGSMVGAWLKKYK